MGNFSVPLCAQPSTSGACGSNVPPLQLSMQQTHFIKLFCRSHGIKYQSAVAIDKLNNPRLHFLLSLFHLPIAHSWPQNHFPSKWGSNTRHLGILFWQINRVNQNTATLNGETEQEQGSASSLGCSTSSPAIQAIQTSRSNDVDASGG